MKLTHVLFLALALALVGCDPKPATSNGGDPAPTSVDNTKPPTDAEGTEPNLAKLPDELKNEAYEYYGLSNPKPMDMEVLQSTNSTVLTGSQTNVLKSVKDGVAIFDIERTGGLAQMGMQSVKLKPDGIYLDEVNGTKIKTEEVEMPNDLTPGKTWTARMSFNSNGSSMDITSQNTVKGTEKFKTKVGEREGILVISTGSGTLNGDPVRLNSKSWYVKGLGGVKSLLSMTNQKTKKTQTITIQETK